MHPVAAIPMLLAAPVALGHTAEELAARNVEARVGIDKLHAIQSLRFSGKILISGGTIELGYVTLLKRPQSVRYEAALHQLGEIDGDFTRVISTQLPELNNALKSKGVEALTVPPLEVFSGGEPGSGGVGSAGGMIPMRLAAFRCRPI